MAVRRRRAAGRGSAGLAREFGCLAQEAGKVRRRYPKSSGAGTVVERNAPSTPSPPPGNPVSTGDPLSF